MTTPSPEWVVTARRILARQHTPESLAVDLELFYLRGYEAGVRQTLENEKKKDHERENPVGHPG